MEKKQATVAGRPVTLCAAPVRMRTELAMVYVRVSSYYFVNTDYVEPTRQSAQRGAARQTVRSILQAWPLV